MILGIENLTILIYISYLGQNSNIATKKFVKFILCKEVNIPTIIAWLGAGKSTLVSHWLRRMAAERYRSAELFFGWFLLQTGRESRRFL